MREPWDDGSGPERPRRRPRHAREAASEKSGRRRRSRLTPEQRTYRSARRRASLKVSFVAHFVIYATVILFLSVVAGPRVGLIVTLAWGIGIVAHYFAAIVAPGLHRRFVEEEVNQQVVQSVSRERAAVRDRHTHTLEQLSASIAHEIRNPITAAKSLVQQMGEDIGSSENVSYAEVALEELDRVERSISHLLRFARDEDIRLAPVSLPDVAKSALETFRDRIGRMKVTVREDIETEGVIQGDAEKLRRVIINLVGNALEAHEQGGTPNPQVEISAGENLAGSEVWLRVRDNGPGIDSESLRKIFNPFYTSKGAGTGLGLAISKKVVDAHGGSLEAHSTPGAGAEFVLTFPKQRHDSENGS